MSEPKNEIVVYQPDDTMRLDVRLQDETVWLTQEQMCQLFQRDQSVVARHIKTAFAEGEVDKTNNMQILHKNSARTSSCPVQPRCNHIGWLSGEALARNAISQMGDGRGPGCGRKENLIR